MMKQNTDTYEVFKSNFKSLNRPSLNSPRIAVGVSGGADSMALSLMLLEHLKNTKTEIHFLTIDHGLRSKSKKEALKVSKWFKNFGAKYFNFCHSILSISVKSSGNIEKNARDARYRSLIKYCHKHKIKKLYLAHNLDDVVETFLINLGRGSGINGLASIPWEIEKDGILILRPLLNIEKAKLKQQLKDQRQKWVEDPMNMDKRFLRVKIRCNIKKLEKLFGITKKRIFLSVENLKRVKSTIDSGVGNAVLKYVDFHHDNTKASVKYSILNESEEILNQVIITILKQIGDRNYPPRAERLDRLISNIKQKKIGKGMTLMNCKISDNKKTFLVEREKR